MHINHETQITLGPGDAAIVISEADGVQVYMAAFDPTSNQMASRVHKLATMLAWAAQDEITARRFSKTVNDWLATFHQN